MVLTLPPPLDQLGWWPYLPSQVEGVFTLHFGWESPKVLRVRWTWVPWPLTDLVTLGSHSTFLSLNFFGGYGCLLLRVNLRIEGINDGEENTENG